jgi:hypothetical protein
VEGLEARKVLPVRGAARGHEGGDDIARDLVACLPNLDEAGTRVDDDGGASWRGK